MTSDVNVTSQSAVSPSNPFILISAGRRTKDVLARVLTTAAFAVAVIPLLWVLYT